MSANSVLLATGGRDGAVSVWDLTQRACIARLKGHRAGVTGCAFLDASTVVSSSLDRSLRVFDLNGSSGSGRCVRTLAGEQDDQTVTSVVALNGDHGGSGSGSLFASGSSDSSVRVWDLRAGAQEACVSVLFDHEAAVYALCPLRQSGSLLLSASWDRTVKLWDLRHPSAPGRFEAGAGRFGRCVRTFRGHNDAVRALCQIDDGHVASAGWDRTIRIWDIAGPVEEEDAAAAASSAAAAAASPSSSSAAAAVDDSVAVLRGHSAWIYALAYLPSSGMLVSGSGDRTLRLSSPETLSTHTVVTGHENTVWAVAALPESESNMTSYSHADAAASSSSSSSSASTRSSGSSSTNSHNGMFVSAGADGQVRLWDTMRQSCVRLQASACGGHTATSDNTPAVHALATWPSSSSSSSAVPAKKLRITREADLQRAALLEATSSTASSSVSFSSAAHDKPALAAVSAAAASPSFSSVPLFAAAASSAAAASPSSVGLHLLAESSEFRPPAMRSRDGMSLRFDSLLEYERWSKSPSSSPSAATAASSLSVSPVPAAISHNTTFSMAASEFTDAREYDAAVAAAVTAAAMRAAAAAAVANTATPSSAAVPSAVPTDASASSSASAAAPSPAAVDVVASTSQDTIDVLAASSFLSQLSSLRTEVLAATTSAAAASPSRSPNHSLAERRVLDMIELVESEIERPSTASAAAGATAGSASASPSPVSASSTSLSAASLSALLCTLLHDAALLAVAQGALSAALRYATRALAAFEGDAGMLELDLDDDDDDDDDDGDNDTESADRRQRKAAEHQLLFDNPQRADAELIDMLPSELALAALPLHDAAASSSSEGTVAPTVIAAPAALYLPLQLLRFACAVETGEWNLAQSLGRTLLGRVSAQNPQRRRVLDDINRALRRGASTTLPLHSLYAHLLAVWHERVLVASATQALAKAQQHKEQGNALFAQAGAGGARSTSAAQAGTADASPVAAAATSLSTFPPSSLFAAAAAQYAAGIAACRAFEELILSGDDDEAQEATCPSRLWFDLAAAQLLPSSVTFFSSLSAMASNTTSAVSSPMLPAVPFSLLQLQFLRASLHSNFAMATLKCASDSELRAQRLLPTPASPSAPSVPPEPSEPQHLLLAQRACEDGLAVMEALSKALGPIRAAVEAAKRAPYAGGNRSNKVETTAEQHDDDDDRNARNVFVENLALGSSLPSLSACSALSSKLYFRHGCAALDRASGSGGHTSMDSVADLSFALAAQLQPDGKVRREIEARKQQKARAKAQSLQAHASPAVPI